MSDTTRYAAFISYSHADEEIAARLHKALETYPVPKNLDLEETRLLSPIFRDAAELTAHHSLTDKIREAVDTSRYLIVLCSPAAKNSHWVNEEIRLFRQIHGEASILCALLEGTPDTAFPPALVDDGREPLAANLGASRESFRLGVTQLAASMLGVGLDQLIQRDNKRRRAKLRGLTAGSLVFAALMGGMAWTAVNARDAAETSRTEAEKMVEFMLTDLKQDLEPVGKLDILDDVGKRVTGYYEAIPLPDMDDDRLARQARARHLLAQVAIDQGKMDKAHTEVDAAYQATQEVLRRSPDNTDAIFAHAQSAYWVGALHFKTGDIDKIEAPWSEYNELGQRLYQLDPSNFDWIMEAAWGQNNLGLWARSYYTKIKMEDATEKYSQAIVYFKEALALEPESKLAQFELSNTLAGRASTALAFGTAKQSRAFKLEELNYLKKLAEQYPDDRILFLNKSITELDYYHDYFLDLSENQKEKARNLLDNLYDATLYDPENLQYKLWFLDYSFEYISKIQAKAENNLTLKLSTLIPELPMNDAEKKYYETSLQLLQLDEDALKETSSFSRLISIEDFNRIPRDMRSKLLNLRFRQNPSGKAANDLLFALQENSNVTYPTLLLNEIRAHSELGNCSEVSSLSSKLQLRGFYQDSKIQLQTCETTIPQ